MFPELNGAKPWSHSFHFQNSRILQTRMSQSGDPMKMNFENYQIQKWVSKTGLEKQMKKWGHLSGFNISFPSYGP